MTLGAFLARAICKFAWSWYNCPRLVGPLITKGRTRHALRFYPTILHNNTTITKYVLCFLLTKVRWMSETMAASCSLLVEAFYQWLHPKVVSVGSDWPVIHATNSYSQSAATHRVRHEFSKFYPNFPIYKSNTLGSFLRYLKMCSRIEAIRAVFIWLSRRRPR